MLNNTLKTPEVHTETGITEQPCDNGEEMCCCPGPVKANCAADGVTAPRWASARNLYPVTLQSLGILFPHMQFLW